MQTSNNILSVFLKCLPWSITLVSLCFVATQVAFSLRAPSSSEPLGTTLTRDSLQVGDPAPTFVLRELFSDDPVFLRDYTGESLRQPWKESKRHVVILSFWATWCEPCREEIPILIGLAKRMANASVQIFLINTQERSTMTEETLRLLVNQRGYSLPVLLDATGLVAMRYGVRSLPTLVVIDKFGIVRKTNKGYHPGFENDLKEIVRELLQESN